MSIIIIIRIGNDHIISIIIIIIGISSVIIVVVISISIIDIIRIIEMVMESNTRFMGSSNRGRANGGNRHVQFAAV